MIKKELEKLTNDEKLIIIYWRIIDCPKQLSVEEIVKRLKYPTEYVQSSIKKFNRNIRLKLEIEAQKKECIKLIQNTYWSYPES